MNLKNYLLEYVSSGRGRKRTKHIDIDNNIEKITFDDILSFLESNDFELLEPWGKPSCDGPYYEISQLEQIWENTRNKPEKTYMYGNWGGYGCIDSLPFKYVIISGEKDKDGYMYRVFISFTSKDENIDIFKRVLYKNGREDRDSSRFFYTDKNPDIIKKTLKDVFGIEE